MKSSIQNKILNDYFIIIFNKYKITVFPLDILNDLFQCFYLLGCQLIILARSPLALHQTLGRVLLEYSAVFCITHVYLMSDAIMAASMILWLHLESNTNS